MKKILVLLSLFFCLGLNAQVEHMKFMGIDMNCDIDTFKEKLIQKGFQYENKLDDGKDASIFLIGGIFSGEKANLFVDYDRDSKLVYCVKVGITCLDKDMAESKYQYFKSGLSSKYAGHYCKESMDNGMNNYSVLVLDKKKDPYGGIHMRITENISSELPEVSLLLINYTDLKNRDLHDNKKYEDL